MNKLIGTPKPAENLDTLLFTIGADTLLVPLTCIAEIIEDRPPIARSPQSKAWLHGWLDWRNQHIPLLAFDGLEGEGPRPLTDNSQIVIFNAIGASAERGFFALVIDSLPRPIRFSEDQDLPLIPLPKRPGIAFATSVEETTVLVPDLEYLEQLSMEASPDGSIA